MGSLPSRIPVQPPYPSTQFDFTYPAPRQASSGSRAAYERTTFTDDFGLPQQPLTYPAPGPSQVQAQAFAPQRVSSAAQQLQEAWPGMGSPSPSMAARHEPDEDRGSRARELHEAEYPYDPPPPPTGPARAPGPGRER